MMSHQPSSPQRALHEKIMRILATIVSVFCLLASGVTTAEELLRNSGFDGGGKNGIAYGWGNNSQWADVDVKYQLDSDAQRGYSQHIKCDRFESGAVQFVQAGIPLIKGQVYQLSIWIKGLLEGPLELMLRKMGSPYTIYASKALRISGQWKQYTIRVMSRVNDPGSYFMVRFTGRGEVWLDEVSLQKVLVKQNATTFPQGNMISNGSFEVGLDRWAVKVREAGSYRFEMPVEFADARPRIIEGQMPQGRRAMQINVPLHGRIIVTTPAFKIIPGQRYDTSLWLKAERLRNVRISLSDAEYRFLGVSNAVYKKVVKVGRRWKRYQLSDTLPPSGSERYYFILESEGQGALSIDGVEVIIGADERFKARHPVEIGFSRPAGSPIFYKDENINLELCTASYQGLEGNHTVVVRSMDFYRKEIKLLETPLKLDAPNNSCLSFSHPANRTGYFQISAEVRGPKDMIDRAVMAIGIVPRSNGPAGVSSPFGGHASFSASNLKAVSMLGVSWLRMHPPLGTKWFVVEPKKGHLNFIDEPIRYVKKLGFYILGSLDTTPRWASSAPTKLEGEAYQGYRAYPPSSYSDWERYVNQTVSHYKGVIDHWEIWNEPDGGAFLKLGGILQESRKPGVYARLVKSAYRAAKNANPDAVVIAGVGIRRPPSPWVDKLINHGIIGHFDVLSFHFYTDGRPGDALDVPSSKRVREITTLLKGQGTTGIPIWETESGFPLDMCRDGIAGDDQAYCMKSTEAVAFVVRNYVTWLSSGVERWFFYHMRFPDRTDRSEYAGFFKWDRSPKPAALGYAVISQMLAGMNYSNLLDLGNEISGAKFTASGRSLRIIWLKQWSASASQKVSVATNSDAHEVRVIDAMGNLLARYDGGESVVLEITMTPVYVLELY